MEEYDIIKQATGIYYYKKGTNICHRLYGPARECGNGTKEWWIDGVRLSPEKESVMNIWYENGRH